jgi:hypothetical protein
MREGAYHKINWWGHRRFKVDLTLSVIKNFPSYHQAIVVDSSPVQSIIKLIKVIPSTPLAESFVR